MDQIQDIDHHKHLDWKMQRKLSIRLFTISKGNTISINQLSDKSAMSILIFWKNSEEISMEKNKMPPLIYLMPDHTKVQPIS